MEDFTFYSPTMFVFGRGNVKKTAKLIKRFRGSRVLLVCGKESALKSGLVIKLEEILNAAGLEHERLSGIEANPLCDKVYEGIEKGRGMGADFILAAGGGSVMDTAKAVAAGIPYDGDFADFFYGKRIEKALPLGTIPTISGSGSEASHDAVISFGGGKYKKSASGDAIRPVFSILDPELTFTVPVYQSACGITDIISHLYERYISDSEDTNVSDRLIEGALNAVKDAAPLVMADPKAYAPRAEIMWAAAVSHGGMLGMGRHEDWNSHFIEHVLSSHYGCAHGAGLAVVMPAVFKYYIRQGFDKPFKKLAERVWGINADVDPALKGIAALSDFFRMMDMPSSLGELGGSPEDIDSLISELLYEDGGKGFAGGIIKLGEDACREILASMLQ